LIPHEIVVHPKTMKKMKNKSVANLDNFQTSNFENRTTLPTFLSVTALLLLRAQCLKLSSDFLNLYLPRSDLLGSLLIEFLDILHSPSFEIALCWCLHETEPCQLIAVLRTTS